MTTKYNIGDSVCFLEGDNREIGQILVHRGEIYEILIDNKNTKYKILVLKSNNNYLIKEEYIFTKELDLMMVLKNNVKTFLNTVIEDDVKITEDEEYELPF
jgi:hypothetical protein